MNVRAKDTSKLAHVATYITDKFKETETYLSHAVKKSIYVECLCYISVDIASYTHHVYA